MKLIFVLVLTLLSSNCLQSQQGWNQLSTGVTLSYFSIHFIDQNTGIAGSSGRFVKTTDGGSNWEQYMAGVSNKITDIKMLDMNTAVAVCEGGVIIKSSNGGINWVNVHTSAPGFIYMHNLVFPDSLHGYAVAQTSNPTGILYRTSDGGDNWIESSITNPVSVSFCSASTGWIHGSYNTGHPFFDYYIGVFKTTNSGQNWSTAFSSKTTSINPGPLYFLNQSMGYRVVQLGSGYFQRSFSGGSSWSAIHSASNVHINAICSKGDKAWFVSDFGKIIYTPNGGNSFQEQQSGVTSNLNSVFFINDSTGWIAGSNSVILKTVTGGITGIEMNTNIVPGNFLLYQNYPNPFNPTTKINYELRVTNYVSIKVFDARGKKVSTLVSKKQNAGSYEVEFDGSNFSSGIYFYKLEAGKYFETKRMLLLK